MDIKSFIRKNLITFLTEEILKNSSRKVIFVDEHGKDIVYDDGDYRIAVDDPSNSRYITLWHKDEKKNSWGKIGVLDASKRKVVSEKRNGYYLSINSINIDPKYRGKGYGNKMYKALIDFSGNDIKGLYSYLPNRKNKKQVPHIYQKFNAEIEGDYQFIDF